jgi:hypothetical protein
MTWDLGNTLKWEPLERGVTIAATPIPSLDPVPKYFQPILPRTFLCNSRVVKVGIRAQFAKNNWSLGAWVSQNLLIKPDSNTDFVALTRTRRFPAILKQLNLIEFPEYDSYPFVLTIDFPRWHREIYLEVWEYVP